MSGQRTVLEKYPCQGILLTRKTVGKGPTAVEAGAGGGWGITPFAYHISFLSPSLWETARYRLKYCLKEPLNLSILPTNHPTNQPMDFTFSIKTFCITFDFFYTANAMQPFFKYCSLTGADMYDIFMFIFNFSLIFQ